MLSPDPHPPRKPRSNDDAPLARFENDGIVDYEEDDIEPPETTEPKSDDDPADGGPSGGG